MDAPEPKWTSLKRRRFNWELLSCETLAKEWLEVVREPLFGLDMVLRKAQLSNVGGLVSSIQVRNRKWGLEARAPESSEAAEPS